ncbi:MAG TPA: outer membrane beta-barrel protein [Bacteroidia bacterium]|nr:outer membrane beta-barrel protein [Bacteroidia bacterium]
MKRLTFTLLFAICLSPVVNAQISAGTFFLGGGLGFSSSKNQDRTGSTTVDDYKTSSFNLNLNAGYFVADNWAVGITANGTMTNTTNYTGVNTKTVTTSNPIGIGVFGRRYFMTGENFGLFAGLSAQLLMGKSKMEVTTLTGTTTSEMKISGFDANLHGGLVWFATPSIGMEARLGILGFNSIKNTTEATGTTPEIEDSNSGFDFDLNTLNLNLGFHYYFGR